MSRYKYYLVNFITILRIVGIPFLFFINNDLTLFLFINFLFITDFLDGFLARKFNVSSSLGAILDLVADKSLVILVLAYYTRYIGVEPRVSFIIFALIAFREIYSMVLRFKHMKKHGELISASMAGKIKTTVQFLALNLTIFSVPGYNVLLVIVIGLSYYSFLGYFKKSQGGKS